ncbi:MAG: stage II sporulation protein R [Bacilli bacterium]
MNKKILFLVVILIGLYFFGKTPADALKIPDEAIRIRVIANSNSIYDQEMKLKVSDNLQTEIYDLLKDADSIISARNIIKANISILDAKVRQTLEENNYNISYNLNFGQNYFPKKDFKGITYDAGYYESVVVNLGKAEGDNWWCVLFPPLCLLEAEESDEVEYKFFVKELIEKYF